MNFSRLIPSGLAGQKSFNPIAVGYREGSSGYLPHTAFELALIAALVMAWSLPAVRFWLLVALISHAAMPVWSLLDFVPKALTFERADPGTITESTARRWTRRRLWRLPLDMVTSASMLAAFAAAVQAP